MLRRTFIKKTSASGLALATMPAITLPQEIEYSIVELTGKADIELFCEGINLRKEAHDAFLKMKKAAYTVGAAMALGEPANDQGGDLTLFKRLVELSEVSPNPWFKLDGDTQHMRSCSAQLTDVGQEARDKYSVQLL